MGLKENFSQAVKELTGGNKENRNANAQVNNLKKAMTDDEIPEIDSYPGETAAPESTGEPYYRETPQQPQSNSFSGYAQAAPGASYQQPNTSNQYAQPAYQPQNVSYSTEIPRAEESDELTVISRNTVIDGNIRSFANMNIDGNIKGNVETTKNVTLNGKIVGDMTCNNANMLCSQIQGNVVLKGGVNIERDTLLIGDLNSTYATINGKLKGNVDINGKAAFKADAVIFGDISASTITVDDGAIIQGYVSTTFLNKEESANIFPDTISIGE